MESRETGAGLPVLRHRRRRSTIDAATGADRGAGSRHRAARASRRDARLAGREAVGAVPELQGGLGLRSRSRRTELRLLRLAALVAYTEIKAPIRPESLLPFKVTEAQVREQIRRWYASKWLAPNRLKSKRARRSRARRLHPLLDLRRAGRLPVGRRGRPLLLHDREYRDRKGRTQTRQVRHVRWEPAAGELRALLRRRAGPGHAGRLARAAEAGRAVPDAGARALRPRVPLGFVVEHYQIVLLEAAEQRRTRWSASCTTMCAAQVPGDTHRNLEIYPTYLGADVQARPGAGLAADLQSTARRPSRSWSTASPAAWPATIRRALEDRAPRARCDHRRPDDRDVEPELTVVPRRGRT